MLIVYLLEMLDLIRRAMVRRLLVISQFGFDFRVLMRRWIVLSIGSCVMIDSVLCFDCHGPCVHVYNIQHVLQCVKLIGHFFNLFLIRIIFVRFHQWCDQCDKIPQSHSLTVQP